MGRRTKGWVLKTPQLYSDQMLVLKAMEVTESSAAKPPAVLFHGEPGVWVSL